MMYIKIGLLCPKTIKNDLRGSDMDKKSKVTVRIFGTDYVLCGDESEEYINNIAFNVDKMMRELSANPLIKPLQVAVLTACNFCDEYTKLKEQMDALVKANEQHDADEDRFNGIAEENIFLKEEIDGLKEQIAVLKASMKK